MDQRLRHIVEHYDEMCIGTDEHFRFHCKQCGKCCINREDILLNPKDLYNISKELGLAPRDTIAQYCEVYLGQNSRIPIVRLKREDLLSVARCSGTGNVLFIMQSLRFAPCSHWAAA